MSLGKSQCCMAKSDITEATYKKENTRKAEMREKDKGMLCTRRGEALSIFGGTRLVGGKMRECYEGR